MRRQISLRSESSLLSQPDYQNPVRRSQFSPSPIKKAPSTRGSHSNGSQGQPGRFANKPNPPQLGALQQIHLPADTNKRFANEMIKPAKPLPLQLTDNKENYEQSPMAKAPFRKTEYAVVSPVKPFSATDMLANLEKD
jgi:hypothetical protein